MKLNVELPTDLCKRLRYKGAQTDIVLSSLLSYVKSSKKPSKALYMKRFNAIACPYTILKQVNSDNVVYPYLRSELGDKEISCISSHHGRSYIVGRSDERWVISKGNGLSYTQYAFLHTREFGDNTLGLLLERDAIRDFTLGVEISDLGIKTNRMEYVIQLEKEILLSNGHLVKPILLQYTVETPYRICDAPFLMRNEIVAEVDKWEKLNKRGYDKAHMIAADLLVHNLQLLHKHKVLHNAITPQNYTWALELLDFELSCSPKHPYENEDDRRYVKELFSREILHTYEIINYIAYCLGEAIDYAQVDELFESYGFDLSVMEVQAH